MTLRQQIDDYLSLYGIYKELDARAKEASKKRKEGEYKLVDAMLDEQSQSFECDDGVKIGLKKHVNISVSESNTQNIRDWLMEVEGDDSDFIVEKINGPAFREWLAKKLENKELSEEELPDFLNYSTRPGAAVYGWSKRQR